MQARQNKALFVTPIPCRMMAVAYLLVRRALMAVAVWSLAVVLMGCGNQPLQGEDEDGADCVVENVSAAQLTGEEKGREAVLYALSLLDIGYRFGGKNPEAGFDCSGMVAYIFSHSVDFTVSGSAANIAKQGKTIKRDELRPGDLVFFNTRGKPFTHVGIYVGNNSFIHAPSKRSGKVRIDSLDSRYFAKRYHAARRYFD